MGYKGQVVLKTGNDRRPHAVSDTRHEDHAALGTSGWALTERESAILSILPAAAPEGPQVRTWQIATGQENPARCIGTRYIPLVPPLRSCRPITFTRKKIRLENGFLYILVKQAILMLAYEITRKSLAHNSTEHPIFTHT